MTPSPLIPVDDVLGMLEAGVRPRPDRPVALAEALGCRLAEDVPAGEDQPPFDRSAIDGFAVPAGASAGDFILNGEIRPGEPAPATPVAGTALRLFTGSAVPPGCGLVMQEDTTTDGGRVILRRAANTDFIRRRGSSVRAGTRLLAVGTPLGPGEIAVLASAGAVHPRVIPPPRVLHITTGSEILPSGIVPGPGQIRDTNGPLIHALLRNAGAVPLASRHVDESAEALVQAVKTGGDFDLLLVSGGSSVGEHDRTPQALAALGFDLLVRRVDVRPGKPLLVARRGDQWAFGLPGNPVSHFATFHVFVNPVIRRMRGRPAPAFRRLRLGAGTPLSPNVRETFWPARLDDGVASPRPWLDSGDLAALAGVNALIRLPAGPVPATGDEVEVVLCAEPV